MSSEEQSYYKLLGTTAKISQRRIKEKYIKAVKAHPPETDPEQFEKIREAYETLKDPVKRKQYDISRKYGGKIEKMLDKASQLHNQANYKKAGQVYQDVLHVDPDNFSGQTGLMFASIGLDNLDTAYEMLEKLLASPVLDEDDMLTPAEIYGTFGRKLLDKGYMNESVKFFEEGISRFSENTSNLAEGLTIAYLLVGDEEKAVDTAEQNLPPEHNQSILDLSRFLVWLLVILQSENWSKLSKVQARFRKFLKNLQDEEDQEEAFYELLEEYEEMYDRQSYRKAEVFLDFAKIVKPPYEDIKDDLKEIKKLARIDKEFQRLLSDESIFPLVIYYTVHWYIEDVTHPLLLEMSNFFTNDFLADLEEEEEYFAAGILKLQKSYPGLYNHLKPQWDDLYKDLTKNFNREMKRGLKKLM
ncbi:DnaJ domain-containing protein [Lentibacillus sp. CBA3610]|uniref:J domain-containing protein n=1 Tax=Lentibacillus sp. CBA3610 TaxID=2518176 RepID=UPI001595775F|nr:DnaJ domain-containing protein [Lentibacillus sp. CBA3610]QKY70056.1 hypothetical protein Len3610_11060 [Lentibacillus sp. CBA3610]